MCINILSTKTSVIKQDKRENELKLMHTDKIKTSKYIRLFYHFSLFAVNVK